MKISALFEDTMITEEELYEMARVQPKNSGLKCILFVFTKNYVGGKHGPRIKVSNAPGTFSSDDNFVVTVSRNPVVAAGRYKFKQSDLEDIFDWVITNYEILMKYWENLYDDDADFYREITKI